MQGVEVLILIGRINPETQLNQIVQMLNSEGKRVVNVSVSVNGPGNPDMNYSTYLVLWEK